VKSEKVFVVYGLKSEKTGKVLLEVSELSNFFSLVYILFPKKNKKL